MTTRRDYLRLVTLAAAAGCTPRLPAMPFARHAELLYGVQIYGLRREVKQDLPKLLRTVRQMGYTEVELHAVVYNHPAKELRTMIEDAGLHASVGHFTAPFTEANVAYAHDFGLEYMVSMLPHPLPKNLDEFRKDADLLNQTGTTVRNAGMKFAYLFHNQELLPQEGTTGFEELMKHTDPTLVSLEIDFYWIAQAGRDPAALLRDYKDRIKLLHLKDRLPGFPTSFVSGPASDHATELGKGTIPWPSLLKQARQQGIRYAFLDYDNAVTPILDSLDESSKYLKTLKH